MNFKYKKLKSQNLQFIIKSSLKSRAYGICNLYIYLLNSQMRHSSWWFISLSTGNLIKIICTIMIPQLSKIRMKMVKNKWLDNQWSLCLSTYLSSLIYWDRKLWKMSHSEDHKCSQWCVKNARFLTKAYLKTEENKVVNIFVRKPIPRTAKSELAFKIHFQNFWSILGTVSDSVTGHSWTLPAKHFRSTLGSQNGVKPILSLQWNTGGSPLRTNSLNTIPGFQYILLNFQQIYWK